MKIGDKVRFLSEVGGGVVTGFQGKNSVLVEDADGFDLSLIHICYCAERLSRLLEMEAREQGRPSVLPLQGVR